MALTDKLTDIANAIRAKRGETGTMTLVQMPDLIATIPSGGGGAALSPEWNDVTFIDYTGLVLYSYSLAEAQALTELPALPTHEGLVCQGWNWTLESIKALNRPVTVGAMYITDDGATRLHIRIAAVGRMTVPLYIGQTAANGVSIDWGDGSAAETLPGTGKVNTTHAYAEPGDYIISLYPKDGCTLSLGDGSSHCVLGNNDNSVYCNMLERVYVGNNVAAINQVAFMNCRILSIVTIPAGVTYIDHDAFHACCSLSSITIPVGITRLNGGVFYLCFALASIAIPNGVTYIDGSAFYNCYSLASITIPNGVTRIEGSAFRFCCSLASIAIPNSVTSITSNTFQDCYVMRYYDFSSFTTIPNLSATNAFSNIPPDCQMLIPAALYDGWSTATNWATYASKMVAV